MQTRLPVLLPMLAATLPRTVQVAAVVALLERLLGVGRTRPGLAPRMAALEHLVYTLIVIRQRISGGGGERDALARVETESPLIAAGGEFGIGESGGRGGVLKRLLLLSFAGAILIGVLCVLASISFASAALNHLGHIQALAS